VARHGTPAYVTDLATLDRAAAAIRESFPYPWVRQYSLKANDVPEIVAEVTSRGFGANVVSRGEWAIARRAGAERADHARRHRQDRRRPARRCPSDGCRQGPLAWVALNPPTRRRS
jgi:diaminopimelate decarboxylase